MATWRQILAWEPEPVDVLHHHVTLRSSFDDCNCAYLLREVPVSSSENMSYWGVLGKGVGGVNWNLAQMREACHDFDNLFSEEYRRMANNGGPLWVKLRIVSKHEIISLAI